MQFDPSRLVGLLGIACIFGTAYLMSNNRKAINYRLVGSGFLLQIILAIFVLKIEIGQQIFRTVGDFI
ncbi:Na+ dependent nucleoside transporter N-terminal domain-containing protein, partial [Enterococcus faecium]